MLARKYSKIKLLLIIALSTVFLAQSAEAFAKPRPRSVNKINRSHHRVKIHPINRKTIRHRPRGYISFSIGGLTFGYGTGLYCNGYINKYVVLKPSVGVFVSRLPFGYSTIFINGDKYYCYNDTYYKAYRTGYVVVADEQLTALYGE